MVSDDSVSPERYPVSDSERLPLALTAVGILVTFASVVGFVVGGSSAFVPSVAGIALGWFLVPFGVYREAEVLESENVLWGPGFVNIAACTVPVVGSLAGIYFMYARYRVASR